MKKILIITVLIVLSFGNAFAYSQAEFETKKSVYMTLIDKKIGHKLDKLSSKQKNLLIFKINKIIRKYERSTTISDKTKLNKLSLLYALKTLLQPVQKYDQSKIV